MSDANPDHEPGAKSAPPGRPPVPWEGAAIAAALLALATASLAGVAGGALVLVAIVAGAALAVVAFLRRSAAGAVVAAALAVTAAAVAAGLTLGERAGAAGDHGFPFPAVVGLPLDRARALFDRHGPVHYVIKRVPYGARGTVLRATGYSTDGTFGPGSTITLVVGTRAPRP